MCKKHRRKSNKKAARRCHACRYAYKSPEDKATHPERCPNLVCQRCRKSFKIAVYPAHKTLCYTELQEKRDELVRKGVCAWLPYHGFTKCQEKPIEDLFLCTKHSKGVQQQFEHCSREEEVTLNASWGWRTRRYAKFEENTSRPCEAHQIDVSYPQDESRTYILL